MRRLLPQATRLFPALFLLLSVFTFAENPTGALRGIVQDARGARVASANIQAQAVGISLRRDALVNSQGEFRIDDLLPGPYRITVKAQGFADAQANVTVVIGSVRELNISMKPGTVKETVNVEGQASSVTTQPIDLASVVHQTAINQHDLIETPFGGAQLRQHRLPGAWHRTG